MKDLQPKQTEMQLQLEFVEDKDEDGDNSYVHVSGLERNEAGEMESYGLIYMPWNEWLGMAVTDETKKDYSTLEIVSHCLFDMTFMGFSEETIRKDAEETFNSPINPKTYRDAQEFFDELENSSEEN